MSEEDKNFSEHLSNPNIIFREDGRITSTHRVLAVNEEIGKKAIGLTSVPKLWSLPFFAISCRLYSEWRDATISGRIKVMNQWMPLIHSELKHLTSKDDSQILVRSSGCDEGLSERGSYYSKRGICSQLNVVIEALFQQIVDDQKLSAKEVGLIIQLYSRTVIKGHLSNERQFCEERRDWFGEFEIKGTQGGHQFKIPLRNWREKTPISEQQGVSALECRHRLKLTTSLKPVAKYFFETKQARVHLEWVWDGERVFIVQADDEDDQKGINPREIVSPTAEEELAHDFCVLKALSTEHAKRYSKVHNVYVYRDLNLPTVPLFILEDRALIQRLSRGDIDESLKRDIEKLIQLPLVIRTDLEELDHSKKQFLRRSDELRSLQVALEWLVDATKELEKQADPKVSRALIFHNFIPAISSAFVYAEPNGRMVQIAGLWGLPEGLYYNSHDQFMVDTLRPKLSEIAKFPFNRFEVTRRCNYKRFFVCPDDSGRWTRKVVSPPHDWRSSIWKDYWLRKMAIDSRMIADREGKSLSIMWFVGVNGSSANSAVMPWFHEPFDAALLQKNSISSRKKTTFETSFEISTRADITKLEVETKAKTSGLLKRIGVNPTEDELLRDKKALQKIGFLAKSIDATIVLEGAILSHAYYQLLSTGAIVEVLHPFIGFEETREFNKLVRDKIPASIQHVGEEVVSTKLDAEGLMVALRAKLVEEAHEVKDAQDAEEIVQELADLSEVMRGILACLDKSLEDVEEARVAKEEKRGGFQNGIVLLKTNKAVPSEPPSRAEKMFDAFEEEDSEFGSSISAQQYLSLSERVDRWTDHRKGENWSEGLATAQIPISNDKWHLKTNTIKIPGTNASVVSIIEGVRKSSKLHLEIRLRIDNEQPDLFSEPSSDQPNLEDSKGLED